MSNVDFNHARLLAEILRLQHWAGGESISAGRIFGLMHGFQSTWRQETESFGISDETQRKVEDLLQDVEAGRQSTDGPAIKDRLYSEDVDEMDAQRVMELCRLQSRFTDAVEQIANGIGSVFECINEVRSPERDWTGALHYMELVDCTEGARTKLHAVFAPTIPRVGEHVTPQRGSVMRVIDVDYVIADQEERTGTKHQILIPHVLLVPADEDA